MAEHDPGRFTEEQEALMTSRRAHDLMLWMGDMEPNRQGAHRDPVTRRLYVTAEQIARLKEIGPGDSSYKHAENTAAASTQGTVEDLSHPKDHLDMLNETELEQELASSLRGVFTGKLNVMHNDGEAETLDFENELAFVGLDIGGKDIETDLGRRSIVVSTDGKYMDLAKSGNTLGLHRLSGRWWENPGSPRLWVSAMVLWKTDKRNNEQAEAEAEQVTADKTGPGRLRILASREQRIQVLRHLKDLNNSEIEVDVDSDTTRLKLP